MPSSKHLVIIGAGPGGYVAALRAAQLGAQVTVVETQALGGVCLNAGCIPSKALLSVVELQEKLKKGADFGLHIPGPVSFDIAQMVLRKNRVVAGLVKGIGTLFKSRGITHIEGMGRLSDVSTVLVTKPDGTEMRIQGDAVILATGSSWPNLPMFQVDGSLIMTSKEALEIPRVPESLMIIGGGVEGCEFASLYSGLGSRVTVVEMMPRLLPAEDQDVSSLMEREFKKRKIRLCLGNKIAKVDSGADSVTLRLETGEEMETQAVLVSVGRGFNTSALGLESVGVSLGSRGEIQVDERMKTSVPGIYAIGDVVGKAMLAHVASAQGKVAVDNILGHDHIIDYDVIPAGIFTLPEIGRVGKTQEQLHSLGIQPRVGIFRYAGLGKAQAIGDIVGFAKILAHPESDQVLGAHLVGSHAADLVHEAALAMQVGATVGQLAGMIHAHPTHAEALMEAAEDVHGMAVHQAPGR